MISVNEAKEILAKHLTPLASVEVPLTNALGFVLASDIIAPMDVPSFNNSAMDGYAFSFEEGATQYKIVHQIQAGDEAALQLKKGEAARIFTGAKLPAGADTVVEQEIVKLEDGCIAFDHSFSFQGKHVRKKGAQCLTGNIIARKGGKITAGMVGLLASVGVQFVPIYSSSKVHIITTGNEIIPLGNELKEGQIFNSNEPTLIASLKSLNIHEIDCFHVRDEYEALKTLIAHSLSQADVILLSGGISVGDYDFVYKALKEEGVEELFYKVKQKPGKPFFAGKKGNQWIFALPGNPASVLACYNQYEKPCLLEMMGHLAVFQPNCYLPLNNDFEKIGSLTHFLKAKTENGGVTILLGQDSFNLLPFAEADCFVLMPEAIATLRKGDLAAVYYL